MRATQEPTAIVFVLDPDVTLVDTVGPLRRRLLKEVCLA
jgi:hypothetical protein